MEAFLCPIPFSLSLSRPYQKLHWGIYTVSVVVYASKNEYPRSCEWSKNEGHVPQWRVGGKSPMSRYVIGPKLPLKR